MHDTIETESTLEIAKHWCAEYERTTGGKATIVGQEDGWIYIQTPTHEGQPWQREHLIQAIESLHGRPDYGTSLFATTSFGKYVPAELP